MMHNDHFRFRSKRLNGENVSENRFAYTEKKFRAKPAHPRVRSPLFVFVRDGENVAKTVSLRNDIFFT